MVKKEEVRLVCARDHHDGLWRFVTDEYNVLLPEAHPYLESKQIDLIGYSPMGVLPGVAFDKQGFNDAKNKVIWGLSRDLTADEMEDSYWTPLSRGGRFERHNLVFLYEGHIWGDQEVIFREMKGTSPAFIGTRNFGPQSRLFAVEYVHSFRDLKDLKGFEAYLSAQSNDSRRMSEGFLPVWNKQ